ncbi:chemotaxis protein CheW [Ghiorsea bivora]|uniref:chemotaxis protein CheW n=1 Tax=Ghiorsea bivora TaxID=1485545 RepID=UPI000690CECC|nr:chemotaxis protein CheW [Ghiorsea bivora]
MAELNLDKLQAAKDATVGEHSELVEYMRVVLNGEMFLLPVASVLSVIRPLSLTPVPMAPDHLLGVTNARGQIFCIVDPGKTLRLSHKLQAETSASRFLLLRHARVHLGIWVEEVLDLLRILPTDIEKTKEKTYIQGTLQTKYGPLPILRVEALFE